MAQFKKHFTIDEARNLIPEIRAKLTEINVLLTAISAAQEKLGKQLHIARGNGKGPIVAGAGTDIETVQKMIEGIAAMGIQIKDVKRGLIDFPHFLRGDEDHEVFLCFELSDSTIEYWHEIEAGYLGRTAL